MSTEEVLKALAAYTEGSRESDRQTATKLGVNRMMPSAPASEKLRRRVSGVMLTAPNIAPKDIELVRREIQEDQGSPGSVQDRGGSP
jgi:hypothetical protein